MPKINCPNPRCGIELTFTDEEKEKESHLFCWGCNETFKNPNYKK